MSAEFDDNLELLITRKLDGELSDEESLAFDKLLIRSPEARRLLEEIEAADRAAAAVVRRICSADAAGPPAVRWPSAAAGAGVRSASRWQRVGPPVAAAACVVLWLGWSMWSRGLDRRPIGGRPTAPIPVVSPPYAEHGFGAPSYHMGKHVQLYGVFDDAQDKLFLLEVERTERALDVPHGVTPAFDAARPSGPM